MDVARAFHSFYAENVMIVDADNVEGSAVIADEGGAEVLWGILRYHSEIAV